MENQEDIFSSERISYDEYKKKFNKKQNDNIAIFVSSFFILLLLFLGIAKHLSPDVDVTIGDNDNSVSDSSGIDRGNVDERLKLLQMEDSTQDNMFDNTLEEKVVIPDSNKVSNDGNNEEIKLNLKEQDATPKPETTASSEPQIPLQTLTQTANTQVKVVVGYYSTKEQAEVAKEIITESVSGIVPFVKAIGGGYTIQVGSYSSREKAQNLANELLRNNYPARIITE